MSGISPTQSNALAALRAFLLAVLPGATPAVFVGTIVGTVLTVTEVLEGAIAVNAPVLGFGVAPGTRVVSQTGGTTGGVGTYAVSPGQTVGSAPTGITMSTGVDVIAGQPNRAPEPANPYFAVMTPPRVGRLATNIDTSADCKFQGSITGAVLTVSDVEIGEIAAGATVFGTGVTAGTTIISQTTGAPGGAGTYAVAPAQTLAATTLSAGQKVLMQEAEFVVQVDFHSPDYTAGDFAQATSTALRDEYGVNFFAALAAPLDGVVPLYADDPIQVGWQNAEEQWESRWVLDVHLQVDQIFSVPAQYSDSVTVDLVDVDAVYPP
jgi:hypothetical protein